MHCAFFVEADVDNKCICGCSNVEHASNGSVRKEEIKK
jgi:hypothetical protein